MKKVEEQSKDFKFSEHFKPITNGVVAVPIKKYEAGDVTDSGLTIGVKLPSSTPESDEPVNLNAEGDSLGLMVVAVGPSVTSVQEGDIVMAFPSTNYVGMELFGSTYYYMFDYSIMAKLSQDADYFNKAMSKEKAEKAEKVRVDYRAKLLGLDGDSPLN